MSTDNQDEIRAENALLKLRLEVDHGMQASHMTGELSPAMENVWLNSILEFEKRLKATPAVSVFKYLGMPRFKKLDAMRLEDVGRETWRLLALMRSRNVVLDVLKPIGDLELYRFITEDLFNREVIVVPDSNVILHFVYEELIGE